jgi:hypothetical protein
MLAEARSANRELADSGLFQVHHPDVCGSFEFITFNRCLTDDANSDPERLCRHNESSTRRIPSRIAHSYGSHTEEVGPGHAQPGERFENVIDASGMIVVPVLTNTHQHFYYHLLKGLANGLLIEDWFPQTGIQGHPASRRR